MGGQGKHVVQKAAFALNVIAAIWFAVAWCTPYWVQSWSRVYSPFKNIGMHTACFAGLIIPNQAGQPHGYHGCWWILNQYYKPIRQWMMPSWFVTCIVLTTFVAILEVIDLILMLIIWMRTSEDSNTGVGKRRPSINILQATTGILLANTFMMVTTILIFGISFEFDRSWMPNPVLNYLSWSYGCAVVATFFFIFSSIAQVIYTKIERQELREPPPNPNISMTHLGYPQKM